MDTPPECSGHSHDHHDHADNDLGLSLRPLIDFSGVTCQNEDVVGMGKSVLKLYEDRLTDHPSLRSVPPENDDDDGDGDELPELLMHIPFTEAVTIHSIAVRSVSANNDNNQDDGMNNIVTAAPRSLKLFVDRDLLDFETAREAPPEATLHLLPPDHYVEGTIDYPVRPAGRFQNISSLQLYFSDNYSMPPIEPNGGDDENNNNQNHGRIAATEITYIGFKGQGTKLRRVAVEAVYESRGMLKDHKTPGDEYTSGHFVD